MSLALVELKATWYGLTNPWMAIQFFRFGSWPLRRCYGAMNEIESAVLVVGGRQLKRVTHTQETGARWRRPQKKWHRKVLNYWDFYLVRLFTQ
jgi:hypothetical protein